jgi:hypothetical protein
MGETTSQIENHIENKRVDLQSNLQELEGKVKSATDWRRYFRQHTGTMVAAAFGGGFLISAMVKGNRTAAPPPTSAVPASTARAQGNGKHEILETFDTIKTALVGVAATKFKGMLGEVVPGFSEHVAKTEAKKADSVNASSGPQI